MGDRSNYIRAIQVSCPKCGELNERRCQVQLLQQQRLVVGFCCEQCKQEYQVVYDQVRLQLCEGSSNL